MPKDEAGKAPEGDKASAAGPTKKEELAESERIRALRERLYSRGETPAREVRRPFPTRPTPAPVEPPVGDAKKEEAPAPLPPVRETPPTAEVSNVPMTASNRRRSIRKKMLLTGLFFFVLAMAVSSYFMFVGKNTISGQNISISIGGPISVGGGEEISFQVSVANQNTIPIESATLIIEYPDGTHSATDVNRELSIVREPLDTINSGELINIPLRARIFGEENQEKEIRVSIEYRVQGSNATFEREAVPHRFKVSTSPVVLSFDSLDAVSSGQELELTLTVQSNSPTPLADILVKLTYPEGFDFTDAEPETVSGEDTWKFSTLKPGEKKTITVRGLMVGYENDRRQFTAMAGVSGGGSQNSLASLLAKAETEVEIEASFIDVRVKVNGSAEEAIIVSPDDLAQVEIEYRNALDTTIYDGEVIVEFSGNALNDFSVRSSDGYYDSSKDTIRWDSFEEEELKELLPGETVRLRFTLEPGEDLGQTPELNFKVTARAKRIFEERAEEEISGAVERTIRVESVHSVTSGAYHEGGPFKNSGPTPPIVESVTQYALMLGVETGANDVTGAEVTAVLPQYVNWLDLVTEGDTVTYNPSTRTLKWTIGDMDANTKEEVWMQVSFMPSLSQLNTTPTLLEAQRFRATDRFTGTVVRAEHPALTTSLRAEADEELHDGRVRKAN